MSFILDALRKSELERQRQSAPGIADFPIARADRRLPVALVAIGVLLALNVAVLLFFLLRDPASPAAPAAAAAEPATRSMTSPPAASATAAPARAREADPSLDYAPGEELAELPPDSYAEATLPPDAPDPTLLPEAPAAAPRVRYADEAAGRLETLSSQVPGLPELSVDLHIYADDPDKRAVFINGRRYVQGAEIAEGPVVEEITREGAVLRHRGRRFLLPRL